MISANNKYIYRDSLIYALAVYFYLMVKNKLLLLGLLLLSIFSLALIFLLVSPENKPLLLVFIPVVLVWMALYAFAKLILILIFNKTNRLQNVSVTVGVSFVVLLFLLSGVGQLSVTDLILILILAIISAFYFYRTWV